MGKFPFAVVLFAVFTLPLRGGEGAVLPVASIGGGVVTEQDMEDWQAAQACYGPEAITSRKAAFMRLYEAAILEEVLARQAKRPIAAAEYDAEAARIDRETRAPDILACIKKYFGGDGPRYRRIFVRPILAQRYIREFVRKSPELQAAAYARRDAIAKDLVEKKSFKETGAARGAAYAASVYAVAEDTSAPAGGEWGRWAPFQAAFINRHLRGLKPGEAAAAPLEDEWNIKFVRLLGVEGEKYRFETLSIAKVTTEDYLNSVAKLPASINDSELRDWVAGIKGNPLIAPADLAAMEDLKR